jgi:hypothetical protein
VNFTEIANQNDAEAKGTNVTKPEPKKEAPAPAAAEEPKEEPKVIQT